MVEHDLPHTPGDLLVKLIWGVIIAAIGTGVLKAVAGEVPLAGGCFLAALLLGFVLVYRQRIGTAARTHLAQFFLGAVGLAGAILLIASVIGFIVWRNPSNTKDILPGALTANSTAHEQPKAPTKNYFAEEKVELGNLLVGLATKLNDEGLRAANQGYRFGGMLPQAKPQLVELIQQVDDTRKLTISMSRAIWDTIIYKNPRFNTELTEIVGSNGGNTPLAKFQVALNTFHRDLSIFIDRYDQLSDKDRPWIAELLRRSGDDAHYASDEFKGWIQQCNNRIDEKRELLR
jgi:hypothetical protein